MVEIRIEDKLYPRNLKQISNPPRKIYVEGNEKILEYASISIIGSRSHSEYGKKMCKKFAQELTKKGMTIVSGMALGIDSIAQETCIENGGTTIAVLPSGFNNIYPSENEWLFHKIIKSGGAIISEYLPDDKYDIKKPIERNRIVSGLSIGTLVIEAGYKSGTSVTARLAQEQGKKLFCVPSSLENRKGITSNLLIQKGGKLVTCIDDILEEFPKIKLKKEENQKNTLQVQEDFINPEYLGVYKILSEEPMYINEICKKSNLEISEVNYKLMMLEIEGHIEQIPGKRFKRR